MVIARGTLEQCIVDVNNWMLQNNLKLNQDKSELIVMHAKHRLKPSLESIQVGESTIVPPDSARNIGVIFDSTFSLDSHIIELCKTAFYHLRTLSMIRRYLSYETTKVLINALVISRLDNCNSLMYGLPKYLIDRVQHVFNCAVKLITLSKKYDHVTPLLIELHWLPVEYRIIFKILLTTFKILNGIAPNYLKVKRLKVIQRLRGVIQLMSSGTLKISSMFHYRALIITEKALATMAPHYGTVYHAI